MPSKRLLRRLRASVTAVGLVIPLVGVPAPVEAERPNEPPFFAIRNARLVTGTGGVIERGTLVLAKGLISDIGGRVVVPPEAWVIDGTGLTVYPGLIDALGDLGLKGAGPGSGDEKPSASPGARAQTISRGPEDRPATTTWRSAADELTTEDERIESWRNAGFTSALTVPEGGILPGQAAFVNLAGERPREMVVQTPAALKIGLDPPGGFRSFPGSLMGVLAYVKQVFADADHYSTAWSIYQANPRGLSRPTYDRSLEPLARAKAGSWPVLIPAHWSKEIHRAIKLGEEIGVQTVIYGAHQGYEAVDKLQEKKVPVLVSVKWPERSKDSDPEAEEPLRVLRLRDKAPTTPGVLHRAGVRFAFYSDEIANPKDIFENLRQAIEAGLPKEAALQALTLDAAEIYGVGDRVGSLEKGKIANLVVTNGDLFEEETQVNMVFIDGRKYRIQEPEMPEKRAAGDRSN